MNTYEYTLTYLRSVADGRELMNSKQLEKVTGWSKKAQHDRRKKGTFPFPYQSNGRLFFYSIYDVANYILNISKNGQNQVAQVQTSTMKPVEKGIRSTNADDFSHVFTFSTFFENITKEANFLNALQQSLGAYKKEEREKELIHITKEKETVKNKQRI